VRFQISRYRPIPQDPLVADLGDAAAAIAGLHREENRRRQLAALAELLVEPPAFGSDRWFHADLRTRNRTDLQRKRSLLRLALLLHPSPPVGAWLRSVDAAQVLRVSVSTVRSYYRDGRLPVRRLRGSRLVRLHPADVERLLEARQSRKPREPLTTRER
jgi:excisionase family DNA binding protein